MKVTEQMISGMVYSIHGTYKITYKPSDEYEAREVDFTPPFRRVNLIEGLEEAMNVKIPEDLAAPETNAFLQQLTVKYDVNCPEPRTTTRLLDKLVGEFIENQCISPSFIVGHPQVMSPLAKHHRARPGLCERFELFVATREVCNAYTELNDPFDQRERFEEQVRQKDQGDEEAQGVDETFINACVLRFLNTIAMRYQRADPASRPSLAQSRAWSPSDCRLGHGYRPPGHVPHRLVQHQGGSRTSIPALSFCVVCAEP